MAFVSVDDGYDDYDGNDDDGHDDDYVPNSHPKRLKGNNGWWQPWVGSQRTSDPQETKHTSEKNDRGDSHQTVEPQATKSTYLTHIHKALKANPDKRSSLEDILKWLRDKHSKHYDNYSAEHLRKTILRSLTNQAKKVESKRTVWEYSDGTYQLHKPVVVVADGEKNVDTYEDRHAQSTVVCSSMGGRRQDGTLEPCQGTPPPEPRQTRARSQGNSQTILPAVVRQVKAEIKPQSTESQPSQPSQSSQLSHTHPEADAKTKNKNLAPNEAARGALTAVGPSSNRHDTLIQTEPAAGSIPVTIDNEPSNGMKREAPANLCDNPKKHGQDEFNLGQIVRYLQKLNQERNELEQKIDAGRNSRPDVGTLTQSANEAQHAADEAQRLADKKQRAAETANKALEEAQAEQSQLAADELHLEKLNRDYYLERAKLNIDWNCKQ